MGCNLLAVCAETCHALNFLLAQDVRNVGGEGERGEEVKWLKPSLINQFGDGYVSSAVVGVCRTCYPQKELGDWDH